MEERDAAKPAEAGTLRIFLCGDVMTGRGVDQALPHPGDPELREAYVRSAATYVELAKRANGAFATPMDPADAWGAAQRAWRRMAPDLRLMNLETTITTSDDFAPKSVNYRMHPDNTPVLLASGVSAFALANNHVLDFGPRGLTETLDVLRRHGIPAAGAGRDISEARAPAVLPVVLAVGSARVLFYSLAAGDSGVSPAWTAGAHSPGVDRTALDEDAAHDLSARIAATKRPGDLAVVSIHWGSNWGYQVPEAHRRFAHALIDGGQASIVHGHSSHHPRPIEIYRDRLILYGCGDFLNDYEGIGGYEAFRGDLVAMYFVDLDVTTGALRRLQLVPLRIRRFRLSEPFPAEVSWLAETLSRESRRYGVGLAVTSAGLIEARPLSA